ncbi:transcriptional regulator [Leptospira noguchii]|nr:transcriptional regulator [Leptospira noguchii]
MAAKKKNSEIEHKVGDYVVYPIHGVGEILEISKKNILGKKKDCYVLEIQGSKMKVMIPVDKAEQVRIRPIIDKKEIKKVIALLKKDEVDTEEDWKIRYQNNLNKIKSGSIYEVGEVCRNLFRRASGKELSIMERKLYESAYNLVKMEVALSKGVTQEEAGNLVSDVLASTLSPSEKRQKKSKFRKNSNTN